MLVAVIVTVPAEFGAVNTPLAVIVPEDAVQLTASLNEPVPCTVAVQSAVPPVSAVLGQDTLTLVIVATVGGVVGLGVADPPPHPSGEYAASRRTKNKAPCPKPLLNLM
jgi:hypothetical protein